MTLLTTDTRNRPSWPRIQHLTPVTLGHLRTLTVSGVQLNLDSISVTVAGQTAPLTVKEFQVLHLLMGNAGRLLTRRRILDECESTAYTDPANSVDAHIHSLRRKIEASPHHPTHIRTVRGVGYIFDLAVMTHHRNQSGCRPRGSETWREG